MTARVLVLHGPNLNLLGRREPDVYGSTTLADVDARLTVLASELGLAVDARQSNHEGELVDAIQEAMDSGPDGFAAVVINPGGYTHTSVAIRDALAALGVPVVEVHISNVHAREAFRAHSYVSPVATAVIAGAGVLGYELALRFCAQQRRGPRPV